MTGEMTSQRFPTATRPRIHQSKSSDSSRCGDSRSAGHNHDTEAPPPRRTLQKKPPQAPSAGHKSHFSISANPNPPSQTAESNVSKRRRSIRQRSSTVGARVVDSRRRATMDNNPSSEMLAGKAFNNTDDDQTQPENNDFLDPINFDDFHNRIMSREPSLSHFPVPGQPITHFDTDLVTSKPGFSRWSATPAVSAPKGPRASILTRRQSNVTSNSVQSNNSLDQKESTSHLVTTRPRRQSNVAPPSSNVVVTRPPRKSIGPGSIIADAGDSTIPRRRTSFSRKTYVEDNRLGPSSQRTSQQLPDSSSNASFLTTTRSQKAKSLQPSARGNREIATPSGLSERSWSSNNGIRTPGKGSNGRTTTPSSNKRMSAMPPHATGLGARTISPTDARRMKRMSLIPHPPPIPRSSPTQVEPVHQRPRSSAPSPSMIPRKSVTPSSSRTTPDPNRKSYSSGISLSSSTSYSSVRNSSGSLQARLSQSISSSRLPTPKPRTDNGSGQDEEEVPPVPAIPKAYESPKAENDLPVFTPRKSSLQSDKSSLKDALKNVPDNRFSVHTPDTPQAARKDNDNVVFHSEFKLRSTTNFGKKNLQPLKLPPLNLMPLSVPVTTKIDALKEKESHSTAAAPQFSAPFAHHLATRTPTTPLTASKSNFFSPILHDAHRGPPSQSRSNSSQFSASNSTGFRVNNSSSALDLVEMPSHRTTSPYISSSLPKNEEGINQIRGKLPGDQSSLPKSRLTGPRPQTQISTIQPSSDLFNFDYQSKENDPPTPVLPPSPKRNDSVDQRRGASRNDVNIIPAKDMARYDNMPPPRLPASATGNAASRMSPSAKSNFSQASRKPSTSSVSSSFTPRRKKSISSDQNVLLDPSPSADTGEADSSQQTRSSTSIMTPMQKLLNSSRASPTPKPRAEGHEHLDKADLSAEEEMRKLGSRRKDFEAAAKKLEELRKRASPKERATPAQALKIASLNIFERGEIIDFKDIYFCGTHRAKKHVGDLNSQSANFGYDDERGDYNIVMGDHLAYRYEVVDVLGKGSFGQVVRCVDHKTGKLVAVKIIRNKKRFHQQALVEVNILQKLREWDPHRRHSVVSFTQSYYFRGHLCISTELLGMNLYELIKAHDFRGFSLKIIRRFTKQLLNTLVLLFAHKVVHCDLKPENILLVHPLRGEIKVIDFGSSCFENEKVYTYIQSRFYRSPEVILGMSYGMPIDMWSLGCILAELYTGYPLFPGENEQEQLACIMEIFGPPEKHLIEKSTRKKLFFDSSGKPRLTVSSKGRRRKPSSKDLRHALKCDNSAFLDFIARCLRWDPNRRLNPHDALKHEFITGVKPPPRTTRTHFTAATYSPAAKRFASATATSGVRPLPEPPSSATKTEGSKLRTASSSSPVKSITSRRTTSTVHGSTATATAVKRSSNNVPPSTGSALPRAARTTSGKPDLAAAAAATSLVS